MNRIGQLLDELHAAETDLAREYRRVSERQAADHGTHYPCRTLAAPCDEHAATVRELAGRYEEDLGEPRHVEALDSALGALRHRTAERLGGRPESGLLLLHDLRHLFLLTQSVHVHWVLLGQAAGAVRDREMLADVTRLHQQTLAQAKWLMTRLKSAAPQVLATR
ncbi:hypothetical protein [Streptomyces chumphonensis]|uniref:hypothetical protein n=1 Tax=Streptomyces chumphonensis TaxID=1214925 RepID=UPI003D7467E9